MDIEHLLNRIQLLEIENSELKEKLKKYTAPSRSKSYYENHKDEIKEKVRDYKERTNYTYIVSPEKKKEYARTAYLKKKEKMKQEKSIQEEIKA
jgi:uncharacterized protein YcaQ